jgi:UDP-glucuronate decarboxylase
MMNTDNDVTGPINLGNPGEFTIRSLAELVIEQTGSKSKLTFHPLPQDDPKQRRPDITMARDILCWKPTIPLQKGLVRTINYFEALLKQQNSLIVDGARARGANASSISIAGE